MPDSVLDLIDSVITDYETGPDAMRWSPDAPDPTPFDRPHYGEHVWIDETHVFNLTAVVERITIALDNSRCVFESMVEQQRDVTVKLRGFFESLPPLRVPPPKRRRSPKLNRRSARRWR